MKARVQETGQRLRLLADQLGASEKVIFAHTVNEPEFLNRKAEHEELMSKIAATRRVVIFH